MTKLIVKPIDMEEAGSYRARSHLFEAVAALDQAQASKAGGSIITAMRALEKVIVPRLRTDDGTPVEDALDQLSANQFDALLAGVLGPSETVPPVTASS